MIRNIYHLALKEFLHLVRDRRTLAFLILIPSILTVIFGYAIGNPRVTGIRTRVLDLDGGRLAYEYVEAIGRRITFKADVREHATEADVAQAEEDLLHDRINAFVVLPKGLSAALDARASAHGPAGGRRLRHVHGALRDGRARPRPPCSRTCSWSPRSSSATVRSATIEDGPAGGGADRAQDRAIASTPT